MGRQRAGAQVERLLDSADVPASPRVRTLLEFPTKVHPYKKWWGTHWRLVALADLGVPPGTPGLEIGIEQELKWLASPAHRNPIRTINGLTRRCASQEGNAVYAASKLGFAPDPRVALLVGSLLGWQWSDGGWNCDINPNAWRSSFHESVTPGLGLAAYNEATGDGDALKGALRVAELLLEHKLFRSTRTGEPIHRSWTKPHYPPYWHYDILQGLRLLGSVGMLDDPRASDALDLLEDARRRDGRFSGPSWIRENLQDAVEWGKGPENDMLNRRAEQILAAAGRR